MRELKYNRWTFLKEIDRRHWLCRCSCGTEKKVNKYHIFNEKSRGCRQCSTIGSRHPLYSHGLSKSPEYAVWTVMKQRCFNKNSKDYRLYGERGVKVCKRWLKFENFINDMGFRPNEKMTIDRINNNGDYEPQNCRWVTQAKNNRNRRVTRTYRYRGEYLTIAELANHSHMPESALKHRIHRMKMTIEEAVNKPSRYKNGRKKKDSITR